MQEKRLKSCFFVHFFTFTSHFNMSMSVSALFLSAKQLHFFCTICLVRTLYIVFVNPFLFIPFCWGSYKPCSKFALAEVAKVAKSAVHFLHYLHYA